jgi:hypothetical protein
MIAPNRLSQSHDARPREQPIQSEATVQSTSVPSNYRPKTASLKSDSGSLAV